MLGGGNDLKSGTPDLRILTLSNRAKDCIYLPSQHWSNPEFLLPLFIAVICSAKEQYFKFHNLSQSMSAAADVKCYCEVWIRCSAKWCNWHWKRSCRHKLWQECSQTNKVAIYQRSQLNKSLKLMIWSQLQPLLWSRLQTSLCIKLKVINQHL